MDSTMMTPPGTVQYLLKLDCDLNGCLEKYGFRHSDEGTGRQLNLPYDKGAWDRATINNHACTRWTRVIPEWEQVIQPLIIEELP